MKFRYFLKNALAGFCLVSVAMILFCMGRCLLAGAGVSECGLGLPWCGIGVAFGSWSFWIPALFLIFVYPLAYLRERKLSGLDVCRDRARILELFERNGCLLEAEEVLGDHPTRLFFRAKVKWARLGGFDKIYVCRKPQPGCKTVVYGFPAVITMLQLYIGRQNWSR